MTFVTLLRHCYRTPHRTSILRPRCEKSPRGSLNDIGLDFQPFLRLVMQCLCGGLYYIVVSHPFVSVFVIEIVVLKKEESAIESSWERRLLPLGSASPRRRRGWRKNRMHHSISVLLSGSFSNWRNRRPGPLQRMLVEERDPLVVSRVRQIEMCRGLWRRCCLNP